MARDGPSTLLETRVDDNARMDVDAFWPIVDNTLVGLENPPDEERQVAALRLALYELSQDELLAFIQDRR
jgi:hypothetical protein